MLRNALHKTLTTPINNAKIIFHSDRGSQYGIFAEARVIFSFLYIAKYEIIVAKLYEIFSAFWNNFGFQR